MIAALMAGPLALGAGCSGDGNGKGAGTAAKRAIDTEAQARAESIGLELSDFPDGWRASASEEQDESEEEEFRRCVGVDYSPFTFIGEATSKDFTREDSTEVSSEVSVFQSEEQAEGAVQEFARSMESASAENCLREFMERAIARDDDGGRVEITEVDVGQLSLTLPDVDGAAAWQVAITFEVTSGVGEGLTPTAYLDFVNLREGNTVATIETYDVFSSFDEELRDRLLQAIAERMTGPPA